MYFDGIKRRFLRTGFHGLRIYTLTHIYIHVWWNAHHTGGTWWYLLFAVTQALPTSFPSPLSKPSHTPRMHHALQATVDGCSNCVPRDGIQGKGEQE